MPGKRVEFQSTVRVRDDSRSTEEGVASELLVPLADASPLTRNRGSADGASSGPQSAHFQTNKHLTGAAPLPSSRGYHSGEEQCMPLLPLQGCEGGLVSCVKGQNGAKSNGNAGYSTLPTRFSSHTKLSLAQYSADDMYCPVGGESCEEVKKRNSLGGPSTVGRSHCGVGGCLPLVQSKLDDVVDWQDWWKHRHNHKQAHSAPGADQCSAVAHRHSHHLYHQLHQQQHQQQHQHQQHQAQYHPKQQLHCPSAHTLPPPPPPPPSSLLGRCGAPGSSTFPADPNNKTAVRPGFNGGTEVVAAPTDSRTSSHDAHVASPKMHQHNVSLAAESPFRWLCRAQAVSLLCSLASLMLTLCSLSSSDWLTSEGWRQGVLIQCVGHDALRPLPFDIQLRSGCQPARVTAYLIAVQILCIGSCVLIALGITAIGVGLSSKNTRKACLFYRWSLFIAAISLLTCVVSLLVYPVCFSLELDQGNRPVWEFGWAYGVAWGGAIFQFGAVMLLLTDRWTLRRKPAAPQAVT